MTTFMPDILGPFKIQRRLGGGGFTEVFLAKDTRPHSYGNFVALKRLRPGLIYRDPVFLESLLAEAELGMLVQNTHVVRAAGVIEQDGEPIAVLEYIDGYCLDALVRYSSRHGMPPEAGTEIARQICEGLEAIHSARDAGGVPMWVVHQDIKPGNLILTRRGVVKIIDLGMARPQRAEDIPLWVRQGTPGYRSPEQEDGARMLTPAADLYSVGVVLFELLTGRPLFPNLEDKSCTFLEHQRQMSHNLERQAGRLLPPGLDRILKRLLAFETKERYSRAIDVIKDLANWQWRWSATFDLTAWLDKVDNQLRIESARSDDELDNFHRKNTEPGIKLIKDRSGMPRNPLLHPDTPTDFLMAAVHFDNFPDLKPTRRDHTGRAVRRSTLITEIPEARTAPRTLFRRITDQLGLR